jgi:murein L,D-transpeptidase YcbB/YkuD
VGAADIAALDVPVERRVHQIELNLERWRWVPDSLGERHLVVNIPEFVLRVVEHDRTVSAMRVVVGKPSWPTPVLSAQVRYIVFNPLWNVPATIGASEVLLEVQKDPDYLARNNIRVYEGTEGNALEVDPASIRWDMLSPEDMPYAFRQDPGPANPVGHVKFMCPNPFNVYLHDTPSGQYFRRIDRAFSHGCVRVEKPLVLAEYVLGAAPGWDAKGIEAAIDTSRNSAVTVPQPLPVHLFYFTAWVDEQGEVEFRRDLYGLDDLLDRALRGEPLPTRDELDESRGVNVQLRDQISRLRSISNDSER